MSQFLLYLLYTLILAITAHLYLRALPRRVKGAWGQYLLMVLYALAPACLLQSDADLWNFYGPWALATLAYIWAAFRVSLGQALLLDGVLFLANDAVPRMVQHLVMQQMDDYMILSAQRPLAALAYIALCLGLGLGMLPLLNKFLPPKDGRRFLGIKLALLAFILIPVLYMGNIQYFLPFEGTLTPLNVSLIRILLCFIGLAALAALGYGLSYQDEQRENNFIRHLMQEQHRQQMLRQDTLEALNRQFHDLKHQLALAGAAGGALGEQCAQQVEEIAARYESVVQTGHPVLDVILSEKLALCRKHQVRLTYMADPDALAALAPMDLCTILGNALDNALEAAQRVADPQKRIIHLQAVPQGQLLYIRVENYFEHDLRWKDGELTTTKGSRNYHGYGLKSIRYALAQYEGEMTLQARDNWFRLNAVIPLQPQEKPGTEPSPQA